VWSDLDRDGIQDAGEPGLAGVIVELLACDAPAADAGASAAIVAATTDALGRYHLTAPHGRYALRFLAVSGYAFSPQGTGSDRALDSDPDPLSGQTPCMTLPPGERTDDLDAGLHRQAGNPVVLTYAPAPPNAGHVTLTWQAESSPERAGFNVRRSQRGDGTYYTINDALIQPEVGAAAASSAMAAYRFVDRDISPGKTYFYRLEDVSVSGRGALHGVVSVTVPQGIYLPLVIR
jgi:hypothetical protein